ncbi:MAG: SWIM zinc finger family protein [Candidatus Binatia bacterium]
MIAPSILAKVDTDRLQRGVEGLATGAYAITLTRMTEQEISAYVTNGDSKTYSVTLTEGRAFCGCGDSMFRGKVCKHAVALALFAIRNPKPEQQPETSTDYMIHMMSHTEVRPVDLKLAKVRRVA